MTVLIFVPLTNVACLPLNVVQSVDVKYPLTDVVAAAIDMVGVVPPLVATGAVTERDVMPVLVTVTAPVEPETDIPVPAVKEVTPLEILDQVGALVPVDCKY